MLYGWPSDYWPDEYWPEYWQAVASLLIEAAAADALGVTENAMRRAIFAAVVTESLGLAGNMAGRADFHTALADLLEVIETAAAGGRIPVSAADSLDLTENSAPGYIIRRTAVDTWQLAPVATRRADFVATATDALDLTESASYPLPADSGSIDIEPYEDSSQGSDTVINITNNENACRAGDPWNALEFRDIDIPKDAIVTAGYLNLYIVTNDDPGLTIKVEKTASPAALSTTASDISNRTPLTTGVAWSAANIGTGYKASPDFGADLMEVFALSGWTRGSSDLVVILHDNGTGGYLRYRTSEASSGQRPKLVVEWYIGGLTITATAADTVALMEDAARQAIIAAATQDSLSLAAATTTAISLLVADAFTLQETVNALTRLSIADSFILSGNVYLTHAMVLTEQVDFFEAITRIAQLRANSVDALSYLESVNTRLGLSVGDSVTMAEGLAARRILVGILADALRYASIPTGDMAGILEAIATDRLNLAGSVNAGWHTRSTAADSLSIDDSLSAVRHFLATALDAGALHDVAALMLKARATATDTAEFAASLRALMRTRAVDSLDLTDEALAAVFVILHALAHDVLALSSSAATSWKVIARDTLEFTAAIAAIMHWVEEVQDALGLSGVAVFLLPNGIVRIEFAINAVTVQFDVAMPRADMTLVQPRIDIAGHGLIEE